MAFQGPVRSLAARRADDARLPAHAGAHQEGLAVVLQLHDLGEVGAERLAHKAAGFGQDLVQVIRSEDEFTKPGQGYLLPKQVRSVTLLRRRQSPSSDSAIRHSQCRYPAQRQLRREALTDGPSRFSRNANDCLPFDASCRPFPMVRPTWAGPGRGQIAQLRGHWAELAQSLPASMHRPRPTRSLEALAWRRHR